MDTLRHNGWKIGIPEGWVDASQVIVTGPMKDEYSPTINVLQEPLDSPTSPRAYATEKRAELQQEFSGQGYEVIEEGPIEIGDEKSFQRTHTWTLPNKNIKITQMQVYILRDDKAIIITATEKSDRFEDMKSTFMDALDKFEFVKE
ncbi:MAG: DcrB-related protein [bacterium]